MKNEIKMFFQGGQFMLELVDHFGANFVIYIMATVEVSCVHAVWFGRALGSKVRMVSGRSWPLLGFTD